MELPAGTEEAIALGVAALVGAVFQYFLPKLKEFVKRTPNKFDDALLDAFADKVAEKIKEKNDVKPAE